MKSELADRKRRAPSAMELSDELGWSLPEIERMERELVREVPEAALEDDFSFTRVTDAQKILNYIYYELSPQERVAFEHLTGWAGKKRLSDKEIAEKLGVSLQRVKRIKAGISKKIQRRMA